MAKASKPAKGEAEAKGGSPIVPVLVATLLVGGAGAFFGMQAPALLTSGVAPHGKAEQQSKPAADDVKVVVRSMAPVTTNLASPANTWVRLESSAVIVAELGPEGDALIGKLAEDVVAYLRTVPLEQIEGASGFQHLREDLNDRVRIRSQGKVRELLIEALVVQ